MSFWTDFSGEKIDGSKANVENTGFDTIPGGTKALAILESAELRQSAEWGDSYQAKWRLLAGEFKNRVIFQSIKAFDDDPKKAARAKHVLAKMFTMKGASMPEGAPTTADVAQLATLQAGLTLELWEMDGKDGNWVSCIDIPAGFECVTGTRMPKQAAAQAPGAAASSDNFDDVGF